LLFRDIAYLLKMGKIKEDGVQYEGVIDRQMVFVDSKSIGMQEFYLSSQSGFSLELQLVVRTIDYQNQKYIEFDNNQYQIIRTYNKGDLTELKCQLYADGSE
jgi:hypothetical protein